MSDLFEKRMTGEISGDFAVFLIGMRFNRNVGSNGDVGIWHETFLVRNGAYECVYNNMPRFGLAKAGDHMPATGKRETATGRMGLTEGDDAPVDVTGSYRE
jgi:hypothetical protein